MPLWSEHAYCVAIAFKMTETEEQRICIQFCIKLEHSSDSEGCNSGQLMIGSFTTTRCPLTHHISCRVVWQNIKSPRWLSPLQLRFGALRLLAFSKNKITFEREEISDHQWDSGKYDGQLMAIPTKDFAECFEQWKRRWENCEVPRCLLWRGLRHHCPVYNVSCVCIVFSKCLYFSYYLAGYLLNRPYIHLQYIKLRISKSCLQ